MFNVSVSVTKSALKGRYSDLYLILAYFILFLAWYYITNFHKICIATAVGKLWLFQLDCFSFLLL